MLDDLFDETPARDWDTDPDGTVRFAVVGTGGFARHLALPAIRDSDYAEVTTLVTGSPDDRADLAAEYDAEAIDYDAYAAGERDDAYDAVYVVVPNRLHLPNVVAAADLGKHVLCEKPLDATLERAEQLVTACEDAGVTLMTAYRMQTDPVVRRLREFVAAGGLGDVVRVAGEFTFPVLAGSYGPDHWRLDAEMAGGGALYDVGVYPLNTARFVLDQEAVAVSGTTYASGPFEAGGTDERTAFHAEFPGGVVGSFSASFSGAADSTFVVHGTDGKATLENAFVPRRDRTLRVTRGGATVTLEGAGTNEVREEFDYFAHCVLTGTDPEPDGADGLADMRAMDAVYEAAAEGTRRSL
jgi:xylose dehydrogenase (NAD/NADP)